MVRYQLSGKKDKNIIFNGIKVIKDYPFEVKIERRGDIIYVSAQISDCPDSPVFKQEYPSVNFEISDAIVDIRHDIIERRELYDESTAITRW